MDLRDKITIGITTKDRWDELTITMRQLVALGLGEIPTIVIDDGSFEAKADEVCKPLKNCTIIREPVSLGLVEERNRIAQLVQTDYLVSLDDDSCFEAPHNLEKAVQYMDANTDVAVLAFRIVLIHPRPGRRTIGSNSKPSDLVLTREYNGCGHMLRLGTFLRLGGYRGYFHHMCEERDFALRAYGHGFTIALYPYVQVIHRFSPAARCSKRNSFFMARNTVACWLFNLPFLICVWRCGRSTAGLIWAALRGRADLLAVIQGLAASVPFFVAHRGNRQKLPGKALCNYFALP